MKSCSICAHRKMCKVNSGLSTLWLDITDILKPDIKYHDFLEKLRQTIARSCRYYRRL